MSSARPLAKSASNPPSNSVCRSGSSSASPAVDAGKTPKIPPIVPLLSGENFCPKSG